MSIVAICLGFATNGRAADPGIFATTASGYLGILDPITGGFFEISQTNIPIAGMGFTTNGNLYGFGVSGIGISLFGINTSSGAMTRVGGGISGNYAFGMTAAPAGTLYAYLAPNGNGTSLYTLNPTNGAKTLIGSMGVNVSGAFASDGNGNVFVTSGGNPNQFYGVNPSTGAATFIGTTGTGPSYAMAFVRDTLYLADLNGAIWSVDTTTGAATQISTFSGQSSYGGIYSLASQYGTAGSAPVILGQPTNETVLAGGAASFTVTVSGAAPIYYQWFMNGTRLTNSSAAQATLVLANVTGGLAGQYRVLVTSQFGAAVSDPAVLTVNSPPAITQQPFSTLGTVGGKVSFGVSASGSATLVYQWYFGGSPLESQTNSVLALTNVAAADAGVYTVVITNSFGSITSTPAILTTGYAPVIATPPDGETVAIGGGASFSVTANGTGPLTYQWQFNGVNIPKVITLAGTGVQGYRGDGGPATNAWLGFPVGMTYDNSGNLLVCDQSNYRVRAIGTNGIISTAAGVGVPTDYGDGGPATNAALKAPFGITRDFNSNLFIVDMTANEIRKIDATGIISTVAGTSLATYGGDGGPATDASVHFPQGAAADASGNLFIADTFNYRIRKIGTNGIITTVAGNGTAGFAGDGGPGTNAELNKPIGLAADKFGNLLIADSLNHRIRRLGTNGVITTIAGTGAAGYSGDGGYATNAVLNNPNAVAMDSQGNIFIADTGNNRIREIGVSGLITTIAGDGSKVELNGPVGIALDAGGNVMIADTFSYQVLKLTNQGPVFVLQSVASFDTGNYDVVVTGPFGSVTSSIATLNVLLPPVITAQPLDLYAAIGGPANFSLAAYGPGTLGYQWFFNGQAINDGAGTSGTATGTLSLTGVTANNAGQYQVVITNPYGSVTSAPAVLVPGTAPVISRQPTDTTTVIGGNPTLSAVVSGTGPFTFQWQLNGNNYTQPGIITTVAGNGSEGFSGDGGAATNASLNNPFGIAMDGAGNLFIADQGNARIRKVAANGVIATFAGNGIGGYSGDGGPATNASLSLAPGIAANVAGSVFIADRNNRVRMVGTDGIITTVAGNGSGTHSGDGGAATNAGIYSPGNVTVDAFGELFVAEQGLNHIRKVDASGIITTIAGGPNFGFSGDGGPATNASINNPSGMTLDTRGNLFFADFLNERIREVGIDGIIATVAGNGSQGYTGNGGPATNASLSYIFDVVMNSAGNLYIADAGNSVIRQVNPAGIITTAAGNATPGYAGDGGPATDARLAAPHGVTLDAFGNLFIADTDNNVIRKVSVPGPALGFNHASPTNAGAYNLVVTSPFGSVTSSVVTLTVVLPPIRAALTSGGLYLHFAGVTNQAYVLQSATNLVPPINWQPVYTNSADAGGIWSFTNSSVAAQLPTFYRITTP